MNRIIKIAAAVVALSAFAAPALAQSSATASTTGSAKVVEPITLDKESDLNFGTVVKPTTGTNTITIDASDGDRELTGGGDAALAPSTTGRAEYTVSGEGGQTFSITAPASFNMTRAGGSETLAVTLTKSAATGTLSGSLGTSGTATFGVGGSFPLASNTASGAYSGSFDVTVAYN